jgi:hypothetical protein
MEDAGMRRLLYASTLALVLLLASQELGRCL